MIGNVFMETTLVQMAVEQSIQTATHIVLAITIMAALLLAK